MVVAKEFDEGFQRWAQRVEQRVRDIAADSVSSLADLPLRDAYELGETPAEFVAGAFDSDDL